MKNKFDFVILIPEEDSKMIQDIEKISDTEITQINSNRYDGEIAYVPIIITASVIIIEQLCLIFREYFRNKKQIKINYKGISILCNSIEEFKQIIDKIYLSQKDED